MRTNYFLTILFQLLILGSVFSQPTNALVEDVVLQPPNAASLGKYGDVPINYSVGLPSISVPLETVQDGSIGLPISLSYHPSGIRVSEMASWVGLGWSLNAGGMISRTVLGIPDRATNGYFNSGGDVSTDPNDVCNIGTANLDGEPDMFHFSFSGYSGKFFFGSNQEIYVISEETDLKIGYEFSGNADFAAFTITTPDGTRYFFGKDPYTQVTAYELMQAGNNATTWRNSWMLLRIESFDAKNTIQLSYTSETYNYKSPASCRYINSTGPFEATGVSCPGSNGDDLIPNYKYNHIIQYVTGQRLTQITSPTKTVDFIGQMAREDLVGTSYRLDTIKCQTGVFCKQFNFSYDYFFDYLNHTNNNTHPWFKRLKLNQVAEISCDGSESKNAHIFDYEGPSQNGVSFLPHRLSKATDHWGFYNGKHGNEALEVNIPATTIPHPNTGVGQSYGAAMRDSDEAFMKYGVLNKITYPTGGHTAFTFEGNTARITSLTEDKVFQINNLTTCGTPGIACCGILDTMPMQPTSIDVSAKFDIELVANTSPLGSSNGCTDYNASATIQALDDMGFVVGEMSLTLNYQTEMLEFKQEKGLPLTAIGNFTNGQSITFKLKSTNGKATFKLYTQGTEINTEVVGGLRTQEIRHHDGSGNTTNDIIKTFDYDLADGSFTSGQLFYIPNYGSSLQLQNNAVYFYYTADAQVPLSGADGRHVMYSRVVEEFKDNGKIVYDFFVDPEPSCQEIQVRQVEDSGLSLSFETNVLAGLQSTQLYKVKHGKLRKQVTYNEAGEELASTEHRVLPASYTYLPGIAMKVKAFNCPATIDGHAYAYLICNPRTDAYLVDSVTQTLDGVTTTTRYSYDEDKRGHLPIKEEMTNSDGQVFITETEYAYHFMDAVYDSLVSQNRIASPIRILQKVKENGDTIQTGGQFTHCDFFHPISGLRGGSETDPIYPYFFEGYEMTWDGNGNPQVTGPNAGWDTLGYIPTYNTTVGKPDSMQLKGWETEVYTWNTVNKKIATKQFKDFLWVYDFYANTSLVKEIIDIDGQDTDYSYDALMRLQQINERDGNVLTDIEYAYKGGSNAHNFIHQKITYQPEGFNLSDLQELETRQYIDGLGRLMQTNQIKHSPDAVTPKDIIAAVEYDNQGRVLKTYEPFVSSLADGSFQTIPNGTDSTLAEYEASPLNRTISVTPPDWYPTHTLYGKNESSISIPGTSISYAVGQLATLTTIEPDGSGTQTGDRTITFTDKRGRTVLVRRQNESGTNQTNTYTLFDKKERPTAIIPPAASFTDNGLIYSYLYSGENNLLEKKVPDAEKTEILYDPRNLPFAYRDGNLRTDGKWMVTQYDGYGRPIITGISTDSSTVSEIWTRTFWDGQAATNFAGFRKATIPADLQTFMNGEAASFAPPNPTSDSIYIGKVHYSETAILDGNTARPNRLLTINQYESFGRLSQVDIDHHLGGFDRLFLKYDFADNQVRETRSHSKDGNSFDFGTQSNNKYDHQGRIVEKIHLKIGFITQALCALEYDHKDLLKTKHLGGITGGGFLQEVNYEYLENRFLKSINGIMSATDLFGFNISYDQANAGLSAAAQYDGNIASLQWQYKEQTAQTYGYTYDFINRLTAANYDSPTNDYGTTYNYDARGNFSKLTRRGLYGGTPIVQAQQIDSLDYDYFAGTNRLKTITDKAPCPTNKLVENVLNNTQIHAVEEVLEANNVVNANSSITYQAGDSLVLQAGFHAIAGTNFTAKIADCPQDGYETDGFVQRSNADYGYDANGNLISDPNKGIDISYNYHNLPYLITYDNGHQINWLCNGSSTKLQKQTTGKRIDTLFTGGDTLLQLVDTTLLTQDYISGFEYANDTLEAIYLEDGRLFIEKDTQRYEFQLVDHLGNARVLFSDRDENGTIDSTEISEISSYYPFGMEMEGDFTQNNAGRENKYLFNGNELQDDFGLNTYDFINRMYDPAVGRFWQIDELAEDPMQIDKSPYAFGWNNPVKYNDPDGNCPKCAKAIGKTVIKSIAKGKVDLGEIYDVAESAVAIFSPSSTLFERAEGVFNLLSPVSTKELKAAKNFVEGAGDAKKVANKVDNVKDASKANKVNNVGDGGSKADYIVTPDGVTIKNTDKYKIPDNYIENPYGRSGNYGVMENGKFKEKLRIDPATPAGKKGPNHSHYHLDGKGTHYSPNPKDKKDPGFSGNN